MAIAMINACTAAADCFNKNVLCIDGSGGGGGDRKI